MNIKNVFNSPGRECFLIILVVIALVLDFLNPSTRVILMGISLIAVTPTLWEALNDLRHRKITIDVFNTFAVVISFLTGEIRSSAFIALMLTFASLLEWYTATRTSDALKALLTLKPTTALREVNGLTQEVSVEEIKGGDHVVVKNGTRVAVDGVVVSGEALVNESSVTGESALVSKRAGDTLLSSTLVESGGLTFRVTHVGADSMIERMAALIKEAGTHKSRVEKLSDRFASYFLPFVALLGLATYLVTHDARMVASLFLVACADDMAVAIPLAMTAALGQAAKRGVIIKGGARIEVLSRVTTLVLDKTGTLTYGNLRLSQVSQAPSVREKDFWTWLAVVEKYSEHPVGRSVLEEASKHLKMIPEPETFSVMRGAGVKAVYDGQEIVAGTARCAEQFGFVLPQESHLPDAVLHLFVDKKYAGTICATDVPREEASQSLAALRTLGIQDIQMFTGDVAPRAKQIADALGIDSVHAVMTPEMKMQAVSGLVDAGRVVGMVGDGINDAPSLARADVGIAMGGEGTAIAAEAADVVILTDDLSRLPEMIALSRATMKVIRNDSVIWIASNLIGFLFVFTGVIGPALAAVYNFATDFLPLINSGLLFRTPKEKKDV